MITKKTIAIIAVSLLLLLIAANLQVNFIYFLNSFVITCIFISYLQNRISFKNFEISCDIPNRAEAARPVRIEYKFRNAPQAFTLNDIDLGVSMDSHAKEGSVVHTHVFKRGIYIFDTLEVTTYIPGGWFGNRKKFSLPRRIIVWPEKDNLDLLMAKEKIFSAGHTSSLVQRQGDDYAGVREYRKGDSLRKIHWKKSAKEREIYVREEVSSTRKKCLILVNNTGVEKDDVFEHLLSAARTLSEALIDMKFEVSVVLFSEREVIYASDDRRKINDLLAGARNLKHSEKYFDPCPSEIEKTVSASPVGVLITATRDAPACFQRLKEKIVVSVGEKISFQGSRNIHVEIDGKRRIWVF